MSPKTAEEAKFSAGFTTHSFDQKIEDTYYQKIDYDYDQKVQYLQRMGNASFRAVQRALEFANGDFEKASYYLLEDSVRDDVIVWKNLKENIRAEVCQFFDDWSDFLDLGGEDIRSLVKLFMCMHRAPYRRTAIKGALNLACGDIKLARNYLETFDERDCMVHLRQATATASIAFQQLAKSSHYSDDEIQAAIIATNGNLNQAARWLFDEPAAATLPVTNKKVLEAGVEASDQAQESVLHDSNQITRFPFLITASWQNHKAGADVFHPTHEHIAKYGTVLRSNTLKTFNIGAWSWKYLGYTDEKIESPLRREETNQDMELEPTAGAGAGATDNEFDNVVHIVGITVPDDSEVDPELDYALRMSLLEQ